MAGKGRVLLFSFLVVLSLPLSCLAEEKKCTQNMEITDPRFSVESEVGVPVTFSDIGCAVVWRDFQCAMDQMKFDSNARVRDYYTKESLGMENAFFVIESGIQTPIGYGLAAFKNREDAEKFISQRGSGRVIGYSELLDIGLR